MLKFIKTKYKSLKKIARVVFNFRIKVKSIFHLFALLLVALVLDKTLLLLEVDELAEAVVEEVVIVERELAPRLVEVLILKSLLI